MLKNNLIVAKPAKVLWYPVGLGQTKRGRRQEHILGGLLSE
jgi:hypothetical protein